MTKLAAKNTNIFFYIDFQVLKVKSVKIPILLRNTYLKIFNEKIKDILS
jgi:hypothetical protein